MTGADWAALDAAIQHGITAGGWCSRGRRAVEGPIPGRCTLRETPQRAYVQRTEWNVRDADATLILAPAGPLRGGTRATRDFAEQDARLRLVADPQAADGEPVREWLLANRIGTLNIAGPREGQCPGIGKAAGAFLIRLLAGAAAADPGQ